MLSHLIHTSTYSLSGVKSIFAYLESMCGVCGVMHLMTTSEVGAEDERIRTLADRRMVISLMNEAFDQDLNGLLC